MGVSQSVFNIAGNAATATVAAECSGNSATATTAAACSGNAATATAAASATDVANALGCGGQSWQDVTASRAIGVTYTNSTAKPIQVAIWIGSSAQASSELDFKVNGAVVGSYNTTYSAYTNYVWLNQTVTIVVPPGATYALTNNAGSSSIAKWSELK